MARSVGPADADVNMRRHFGANVPRKDVPRISDLFFCGSACPAAMYIRYAATVVPMCSARMWLCASGCDFVVLQFGLGWLRLMTDECRVVAGHNNVTCADYGCYAQWSATKVAFL